jgi:hypothetical protein
VAHNEAPQIWHIIYRNTQGNNFWHIQKAVAAIVFRQPSRELCWRAPEEPSTEKQLE